MQQTSFTSAVAIVFAKYFRVLLPLVLSIVLTAGSAKSQTFEDSILVHLENFNFISKKTRCVVSVTTVGTHADPLGTGGSGYTYVGYLYGQPWTRNYSSGVAARIGINDDPGNIVSYTTNQNSNDSPGDCNYQLIADLAWIPGASMQYAKYTSKGGPVAFFNWKQQKYLNVNFDGSESFVSTPQGHKPVASYEWKFGNNKTSSEASPTHDYSEAGIYQVSLIVRDEQGRADTITRTVEVDEPVLSVTALIEEEEVWKGDILTIIGTVENASNEQVMTATAVQEFGLIFHFHDSLKNAYKRNPVIVPLTDEEVDPITKTKLTTGGAFTVERQYRIEQAGAYRWVNTGPYTEIPVYVEARLIDVLGTEADGDTVRIVRPCDKQVMGKTPPASCQRNHAHIRVTNNLVVNSDGDGSDNNHGDGKCSTGKMITVDGKEVPECTLRAAIEEANAKEGKQEITFNIEGSGVHTIQPSGTALPPLDKPAIIDATTQPGYTNQPLIFLDGSLAGVNASGFILKGDADVVKDKPIDGLSAIKGFAVGNFGWYGIQVSQGSGNIIESNYIGVDPSGKTAVGNGMDGLELGYTFYNTIVGNVISGNDSAGVSLIGGKENKLIGNLIGTNASGTAALGNGREGVYATSSGDNTIGGMGTNERNIISGNLDVGIRNEGGIDAVVGNRIGTSINGASAIPNVGGGIESNFSNITDNLISGNQQFGLRVWSNYNPGTTFSITRNLIGTDVTGKKRLANQGPGIHYKTDLQGIDNVIGTVQQEEYSDPIDPPTTPANVISGNAGPGIHVETSCSIDCQKIILEIRENFIGTDITGMKALGNVGPGVLVEHTGSQSFSKDNHGRVDIESNLISGNADGIVCQGNFYHFVDIDYNFIGSAISGKQAIGNLGDGIRMQFNLGATGLFISPDLVSIYHNTIVGNGKNGIVILGGDPSNLSCDNCFFANIASNHIGLSIDGSVVIPIGNKGAGIFAGEGAQMNRVGSHYGFNPGGEDAANIIAYNEVKGIIVDNGTLNNFRGNWIFDNGPMSIDLNNDGPTPNDIGDNDAGANEQQNFPDIADAYLANGEIFIKASISSKQNRDYWVDLFTGASSVTGFEKSQGFIVTRKLRTPLLSDGFGDFRTVFHTRTTARAIVPSTVEDAYDIAPVVVPVITGWLLHGMATEIYSDVLLGVRDYGYSSEMSFGNSVEVRAAPQTLSPSAMGDDQVEVDHHDGFAVNDKVIICPGCPNEEVVTIEGFGSIIFKEPLQFAHEVGEAIVPFARSNDTVTASADTSVYFHAGVAIGTTLKGVSGLGSLAAERFRRAPKDLGGVSDSTILPHHWVVTKDGTLTFNDSTLISFWLPGIPNLVLDTVERTAERLNVYHRPVPGSGSFTQLKTRYEKTSGSIVASGFTTLGEFVLAKDRPLGVQTGRDTKIPSAFTLSVAYPNPFSATTSLTLALPQAGEVAVVVFNSLGQQVAVLHNGRLSAGTHTVQFDARNLASGVYFIQAKSAQGGYTRQVLYMP